MKTGTSWRSVIYAGSFVVANHRGNLSFGKVSSTAFLVYVAAILLYKPIFTQPLGFFLCAAGAVEKSATERATVSAYMQSVMEAMGVTVLGSIKGTAIFHNQFLNQEEIDQSIDEILTSLEQDFYKETQLYSESEKKRREKFSSLMDQEEISKKLFHEDYKYWANKKETSEIL